MILQRETIQPGASKGTRAVLHLNGTSVGEILIQGWDASWTYGTFRPEEAFGEFAAMFGRWSLLMHEDEDRPLTRDMAHELRDAEQQIDTVRARVYFPHNDHWHDVAQVNIDGSLIEWKEF